jgi:hypothetical protein
MFCSEKRCHMDGGSETYDTLDVGSEQLVPTKQAQNSHTKFMFWVGFEINFSLIYNPYFFVYMLVAGHAVT